MTFGIPFQRVHDVKALGFHQLFGRFKRPFFIYEKVSSQSSAVPPIVQNGIHAVAITQNFLLRRVRVSTVR